MFVINTILDGKYPKWYNPETREIKCCFCNNTYTLSPSDRPERHSTYVCSDCDEKMQRKYEFTHHSFRSINNPNNKEIYKPGLIDSLYKKYGILNEKFLHDLNKSLAEPCPICQRYHTRRDRVSVFNICKDCVQTLPGYTKWKNGNYRAISIGTCEKHGFYVSSQLNGDHRQCPVCAKEIKSVECKICGKTYESHDHHLERLKNGETLNICDDCREFLPGYDHNKSKEENISLIPRWCNNCKKYVLVKHNFDSCPVCDNKLNLYKIICKKCSKEAIVSNPARAYCDECEKELNTSDSVFWFKEAKSRSTSTIIDDMLLLPVTSYVDKEQFNINEVKTCKHCGRLFVSHSNNRSDYCGNCYHIVQCKDPMCGESFAVKPWKYEKRKDPNTGEYDGFCCIDHSSRYYGNKRWAEDKICSAPGSKTPVYDEISYKNVQYKDEHIEINDNNIYKYMGVSGVWYREDENGKLLQVSETANIFNEYLSIKNIINKILDGSFDGYCSYVKMKRDGIDLSKTKTFILTMTDNRKRRFDVEANYAITRKAKYWKPAPGYQIKTLMNKDNT